MKTCDYCGRLILFAETTKDYGVFCSGYCATEGAFLGSKVLDENVQGLAWALRENTCPTCNKNRPLDIFPGKYPESYFVRSVLRTKNGDYWENLPELRCGACNLQSIVASLPKVISTARLGWGALVLSPKLLARNLFCFNFVVPNRPSALMLRFAKLVCKWEVFWEIHHKMFLQRNMSLSEYCDREWLVEAEFLAATRRVKKISRGK